MDEVTMIHPDLRGVTITQPAEAAENLALRGWVIYESPAPAEAKPEPSLRGKPLRRVFK